MFITMNLVDGRKITKEANQVFICNPNEPSQWCYDPDACEIAVNSMAIVTVREAKKEEIEHSKLHGW